MQFAVGVENSKDILSLEKEIKKILQNVSKNEILMKIRKIC